MKGRDIVKKLSLLIVLVFLLFLVQTVLIPLIKGILSLPKGPNTNKVYLNAGEARVTDSYNMEDISTLIDKEDKKRQSELVDSLEEEILEFKEVQDTQTNYQEDNQQDYLNMTESQIIDSLMIQISEKYDSIGDYYKDLSLLAATVYLEASPQASLEDCVKIARVIDNRLKDKEKWHLDSYSEVIYQNKPIQFAVTQLDSFEPMVNSILSVPDEKSEKCIAAALIILSEAENIYPLEAKVQYFYGDSNKREWGKHTYYGTYGGNSFFF